MCGICGYGFVGNDARDGADLIKRMASVIKHRGPDDEGFFVDGEVALGHRRLSIIDLSTGRQPIFNEDKSACIVFNGEIYNFPDLREMLDRKGHRFATASDTEVILHLYEECGVDCLEMLRGMFAFAIWDVSKQRLFIARDRLGIKPLYYAEVNGGIVFGSEIKSILSSGLVGHGFNAPSVDQYLALNYTIGPETILKGIRKLMPGHFLVAERGSTGVRQYWDFNEIEKTGEPFEKCVERLEALLEETTKIHLISDVPVGAFLSGGVDSSVTVGIMARLSERPVKTFTVGYEDYPETSELAYARVVAKRFATEHHELILKPRKFMDIVSEVVWHLEEPVAEFATIPLLLLSRMAKEHVTVMLSGEGADEIFAGYPIYRFMNHIEHYQKLPGALRSRLLDPIGNIVLGNRREGKYRQWLSDPLQKRYVGNGSYFTQAMRERLYSKDFKESLGRGNVPELVESYYSRVERKDAIDKMLYLDTKTWLPEDLLIKADKMTMAASLELRVPFLDHKLVEFAASLPSDMKVTATKSKFIFKKYAETLIPKEIVYRKKKGFPVPVKQWLRGDLKQIAGDILLDTRTRDRGLFDMNYVHRLFDKHSEAKDDLSKNVWNLLILEMWFRMFVDGEGPRMCR